MRQERDVSGLQVKERTKKGAQIHGNCMVQALFLMNCALSLSLSLSLFLYVLPFALLPSLQSNHALAPFAKLLQLGCLEPRL